MQRGIIGVVGLVFIVLVIWGGVRSAPTEPVQGKAVFPIFTDVAPSSGVANTGWGHGVAWGDYDNDGDLDLYVTDFFGPNRLYRNEGHGVFTDVAVRVGGLHKGSGGGIAWGDYDNDGDLDLYVGSGGWLYRNNGDGTFTDVAPHAGVAHPVKYANVVWGDYDNDGHLDLYVVNGGASRLYRNNGDGTFTDVAPHAGVTNDRPSLAAAWGDYDNDGHLDLYVVNKETANRLYRNNGDGTFTDVASIAGVNGPGSVVTSLGYTVPGGGRSVAWGDYDNDGDLDLCLAGVYTANLLYRNNGDGTFTDVASIVGVADNIWLNGTTTVAWGDYDNDGDLDLYLTKERDVNRLYRNEGNGTFTECAATAKLTNSGGVGAWGDYDNDGDLDLYLANLGRPNQLYRNEGTSNHWLIVTLVGTVSNRSGIGAVVTAVTGSTRQRRDVDGGSGFYSQPSLPVEFGFGSATLVDSLTIRWPSGIVQVLTQVPTNQFLTVTEPPSPPLGPPPIRLAISLFPITGKATLVNRQVTVQAGATLVLVAWGITAESRPVYVTPVWTVEGAIGTITPAGRLTAGTQAGMQGRLVVTARGLRDTLTVTLRPGPLRRITITPATVTLKPGGVKLFRATGSDAFGNPFPLFPLWHTVGGIGTIDKRSGVFRAGLRAGTGYVIAYADSIFGDTGATLSGSAKVVVEAQELPRTYAVSQNAPNPFNPETTISYDLPEVAQVRLVIYALSGQAIRTLVYAYHHPPGHYAVVWDGRDAADREVASGVYLYRLEVMDRGFVATKRMLLMK